MSFPEFDYPLILETDASLKGYGAILSEKIDGKVIVIAYAIKKIKHVMRKYTSFNYEFQAMHWGITKKFHDYLIGIEFQFSQIAIIYPK